MTGRTKKRHRHHHHHKKHKTHKKHKKHHRKIKFKPEKCAPKEKGDALPFTCYSKRSLHNLKNIWNMRHPDVPIHSNDPNEIWHHLKHNMRKTCHKESCWLRHQCIKHDLPSNFYLQNFSPKQPKEWTKKPNTWLTSIEIEQLMKQYERKYKHFRFLGPSP